MIVEIRGISEEKMREIEEKCLSRMDLADITDIDGWNRTIVINAGSGETQLLHTHAHRSVYRRMVGHIITDLWMGYPDKSSITVIGGHDGILDNLSVLLPALNIDVDWITNISDFIMVESKKNLKGYYILNAR